MHWLDSVIRRLLDVGAALVGLLLLSPVILLLAFLVRISSRGPIFFRARRVGKDGREFGLLKFRTMVQDADRKGPGLTLSEDSRITPMGRRFRAHRLDEIPQLWNVLKGDMSLVGPRPEDPRYVAYYSSQERRVLAVRPGITGPAQIAFRNEGERLAFASDPEQTYIGEIMPAKLRIDLAYLDRRTVLSDLGILFRTLRIYLKGRILALSDLISLSLAFGLAFVIRFDNTDYSISQQLSLYWPVFLPMLGIKLIVFERLGLYRRLWRYASVKEMLNIVVAVVFSSTLSGILILVLWAWPWSATFVTGFPRSVIFIDAMLTLLLVGGVRFFLRWRHEVDARPARSAGRYSPSPRQRRVLIVGAGDLGVMTAREIERNPNLGLRTQGFIDDDPDKQGQSIHGLSVMGALNELPQWVNDLLVDEVLVAIPHASGSLMRRIFDLAKQAGVPVRTLPDYDELIGGGVSVRQARQVQLEDLLRRAPTPMDMDGVAGYVSGRSVLVTGAGGSIGSEICRQVARFGPTRLVLLDHGEENLSSIDVEMRRDFPSVNHVPVLGNILDVTKVESILSFYRPQVVFHAAAYKHVPLMESNEDEGVLNNVLGTLSLVTSAETAGVERLVFISTDKAVEPINVMGMTKQVGEWIVQRAAARCGRPYVVVRFGNVLGSTGSVVPLFRAQIVAGGPVTVTHPQVTRYFMTTPEAVRLVLQAAAIGRGGEVFVLDMGQPVRIYDLACDLIRLHGLEPEVDIPIVFTGLRPGEKLHEVLHSQSEQVSETSCAGIRVVSGRPSVPEDKLERALEQMERLAKERRRRALRDFLVQFVTGT